MAKRTVRKKKTKNEPKEKETKGMVLQSHMYAKNIKGTFAPPSRKAPAAVARKGKKTNAYAYDKGGMGKSGRNPGPNKRAKMLQSGNKFGNPNPLAQKFSNRRVPLPITDVTQVLQPNPGNKPSRRGRNPDLPMPMQQLNPPSGGYGSGRIGYYN